MTMYLYTYEMKTTFFWLIVILSFHKFKTHSILMDIKIALFNQHNIIIISISHEFSCVPGNIRKTVKL